MELIGGRAIHPVNVRVGGFYSLPTRADLDNLAVQLRVALEEAIATVEWVAGFDFPELVIEHEFLALTTPGQYPIERGTALTSSGRQFGAAGFEDHVIEEQVPHSTALHARLAALPGRYLTGPLARYALNSQWLPPTAAAIAASAGLGAECRNSFQSIVVRAVEIVCALEEAIRIIDDYAPASEASVPVTPRAGRGYGLSEAPRGVLYQGYEIGADGTILSARIVPPTSQNQAAIEHDVGQFAERHLDLDDEQLARACERVIRNYDPCISCATHFLELHLERR
jgi:sulfhydrogenase subunit alpha